MRTELSPPWSSDWITDEGRRKLAAAGIAPPHNAPQRTVRGGPVPLNRLTARAGRRLPALRVDRGRREHRPFSATACKALHRCEDCREPFEYVKEI